MANNNSIRMKIDSEYRVASPTKVRCEEGRDDDPCSYRGTDNRCYDASVTCTESSTAQSAEASDALSLVVVHVCSNSSITKMGDQEQHEDLKSHASMHSASAEEILLQQLQELNRTYPSSCDTSETCLPLHDSLQQGDRDDASLCTLSSISTSVKGCEVEWSLYEDENSDDPRERDDEQLHENGLTDSDPTFDWTNATTNLSSVVEQASVAPSGFSVAEALETGDDRYFTEGFICVGILPRVY